MYLSHFEINIPKIDNNSFFYCTLFVCPHVAWSRPVLTQIRNPIIGLCSGWLDQEYFWDLRTDLELLTKINNVLLINIADNVLGKGDLSSTHHKDKIHTISKRVWRSHVYPWLEDCKQMVSHHYWHLWV